MPVKNLMLDEVDAYPYDVDGEGDPVELARNRLKTFARSKELDISTPTTKGMSRIARGYEEGDRRRLYVPCPSCLEKQPLEFKNLQWLKDEDGEHLPETVALACVHCGVLIDEYKKTWMLENKEWIAEGAANDKHHSYHINSLYSPLGWESWASIVIKFLAAKHDVTLLKTFTNTIEGLPFEETSDKIDVHSLQARAVDYPLRECPAGVLVLTAGVDTQPDRFEVVVWGHGSNQQTWPIDYHVIWGSPSLKSVRAQLDEYLATPFPHVAGCDLVIQATAIDSGGHNTQDIYDYCRLRKSRRIFATKGYSTSGRPILGKPTRVDVTIGGKTMKKGAEVWMVGADTTKMMIYNRLGIDDPDADGFVHFSKHLTTGFYKQLTSEKLATRYVKGHPRLEWVKPAGVRNEVLDCTVGAHAAAYYLGLHRWRPAQWRRLEEKVQPATPDMFSAGDVEMQDTAVDDIAKGAKPARRKSRPRRPPRSGFVQGDPYGR